MPRQAQGVRGPEGPWHVPVFVAFPASLPCMCRGWPHRPPSMADTQQNAWHLSRCNADARNRVRAMSPQLPAAGRPAVPGRGSLARPSLGSRRLSGEFRNKAGCSSLAGNCKCPRPGPGGACPCGSPAALAGRTCWIAEDVRASFIMPFSMAVGWSPGFCGVVRLQGLHHCRRDRSGSLWCLNCNFLSSLGRTPFPLDIPFVKRLIKSFANFLLVCLSPICHAGFLGFFDI